MKIATVIGARPQFIKSAPVSRALRSAKIGNEVTEFLIHTGQHYDHEMSQVFFDELGLAVPRYNLGIGSASHGQQTGQMLAALDKVLVSESPDCVLVYGDTNSTLAAALAASKLNIPIAHVEAGLRSFNRRMPEEINRIVADHISGLLFAPTHAAVNNLRDEGITNGVHLVGDVMQDALAEHMVVAESKSHLLADLGLTSRKYILATVHRAENTDAPERLVNIVTALNALARECPVIWPIHPRTLGCLTKMGKQSAGLRLISPVPYLEMLALERHAEIILTDSGGIQKEARWLEVPCVTLRDETEWRETLEGGWNRLAGADSEMILESSKAAKLKFRGCPRNPVKSAHAAESIVGVLRGAHPSLRLHAENSIGASV